MATEYFYPNGTDNGWDSPTSASHEVIDEGIDGPGFDDNSDGPDDTDYIAEDTDDTTFNISSTGRRSGATGTVITDSDTVNRVDIKIRAKTTGGGNDKVNVDLFVGETVQGSQYTTANLTGSFVTYTANGTTQGWDTDYTQAQIDDLRVRLITNQTGKAEALGVQVSEVEIQIDYTEAAAEPYSAYHPTDQLSVRTR